MQREAGGGERGDTEAQEKGVDGCADGGVKSPR